MGSPNHSTQRVVKGSMPCSSTRQSSPVTSHNGTGNLQIIEPRNILLKHRHTGKNKRKQFIIVFIFWSFFKSTKQKHKRYKTFFNQGDMGSMKKTTEFSQ